jgi:hypothetical protein
MSGKIKRIAEHILDHRPYYDVGYGGAWFGFALEIAKHYPRDMWNDMVGFYMVLCCGTLLVIVSILQKITGREYRPRE